MRAFRGSRTRRRRARSPPGVTTRVRASWASTPRVMPSIKPATDVAPGLWPVVTTTLIQAGEASTSMVIPFTKPPRGTALTVTESSKSPKKTKKQKSTWTEDAAPLPRGNRVYNHYGSFLKHAAHRNLKVGTEPKYHDPQDKGKSCRANPNRA